MLHKKMLLMITCTCPLVLSTATAQDAAQDHAAHSAFDFLDGIPSVAFIDRVQEENAVAPRTRGARLLFERTAASVVLIADNSGGQGSGVVISRSERLIVTNWHVVSNAPRPSVFFKPPEGITVEPASMHVAEVLYLHRDADLAILRVAEIPEHVAELPLGELSSVSVGADVHAIGHPTGELWTYTRGIVSQVRASYEWRTQSNVPHRATVIQTQTPINPGNSGGPLMDDEGRLIGINTFVRAQTQGLNYAVSVEDVQRALTAMRERTQQPQPPGGGERTQQPIPARPPALPGAPPAAPPSGSAPPCIDVRPGFVGLPASADGTPVDSNCDGVADLTLVDRSGNGLADLVLADTNGDGRPDLQIEDSNGDGFLDYWRIDRTGDGRADLEAWDVTRDGRADKFVRIP